MPFIVPAIVTVTSEKHVNSLGFTRILSYVSDYIIYISADVHDSTVSLLKCYVWLRNSTSNDLNVDKINIQFSKI